jgi:hypothetical protein
VYYIFGVLFVVFLILVVTCAEITIVLCYFQLCSEDYRWWWRAFFTSGSSALYMFCYSAFYFATKLEITKLVSTLMYFGYMLILSVSFFLLTGARGCLPADACLRMPPACRVLRGSRLLTRCPQQCAQRRHCGLSGVPAVRARHLWQRQD